MKQFLMALAVGLSSWQVASAQTQGTVTLRWTAPGDDGNVGTAALYDVRWATANITEQTWGNANQVSGEPTPRVAGTQETFSFPLMLTNGQTYYFAIKAADEASNWSGLSNVVTFTVDTGAPATIIIINGTYTIP